MTASESDGQGAGKGWLKAAMIVGGGAPTLFGTFLGNIWIILGLPGSQAPGLAYSYWEQTFFFTILAIVAVSFLLLPYWLAGRGQGRLGGSVAALVGLGMIPVGVVVLPTFWIVAGPLAFIGGVQAFRGAGSADRAEGAAT